MEMWSIPFWPPPLNTKKKQLKLVYAPQPNVIFLNFANVLCFWQMCQKLPGKYVIFLPCKWLRDKWYLIVPGKKGQSFSYQVSKETEILQIFLNFIFTTDVSHKQKCYGLFVTKCSITLIFLSQFWGWLSGSPFIYT